MADGGTETARSCGSCTLCCKLLGIRELEKPQGSWCPHCRPGKGCRIYDERPPSCREFNCQWLMDETLPEAFRPDRSKVVLYISLNGERLIAECDPAYPLAWRSEPLYGHLRRWGTALWAQKKMLTVMVGPTMWVITPRHDVHVGPVDPDVVLAIRETLDGVDIQAVRKPDAAGG
jgi:hypothetical protein